jgi:CopG family transcriptional regulator, nickel-responsive regulator
MDRTARFGVSMEKELLEKFDSFIKSKDYRNRSEAIRDLIRKIFVDEEWDSQDKKVAGAIIIVYDHHRRDLLDNLVSTQHDFQETIISSQHIHLDHHNCMEVIVVKGLISKLFELEAKLKALKGVKHASLAKSTLGAGI